MGSDLVASLFLPSDGEYVLVDGMPRRLRLQYADAIYHLMARGNGRQHIVCDDVDRDRLQEHLRRAAIRYSWHVYAFAIITEKPPTATAKISFELLKPACVDANRALLCMCFAPVLCPANPRLDAPSGQTRRTQNPVGVTPVRVQVPPSVLKREAAEGSTKRPQDPTQMHA
jgi:hypothetical protein